MTVYNRGDMVLVGFVFSDESGRKLRPAIVSSAAYNGASQEIIVAAVTSNVRRRLFGDYLIANWKEAGLLFPSVATAILRAIKQTMIEKKLGSMPTHFESQRSIGIVRIENRAAALTLAK